MIIFGLIWCFIGLFVVISMKSERDTENKIGKNSKTKIKLNQKGNIKRDYEEIIEKNMKELKKSENQIESLNQKKYMEIMNELNQLVNTDYYSNLLNENDLKPNEGKTAVENLKKQIKKGQVQKIEVKNNLKQKIIEQGKYKKKYNSASAKAKRNRLAEKGIKTYTNPIEKKSTNFKIKNQNKKSKYTSYHDSTAAKVKRNRIAEKKNLTKKQNSISNTSYNSIESLNDNKQIQKIQRNRNISLSTRTDIFERDNYTCQICGKNKHDDGVKLEIDHIIPVSRGGSDNINNLQTLCFECNRGKSDKILHNHIRNQRTNNQTLK